MLPSFPSKRLLLSVAADPSVRPDIDRLAAQLGFDVQNCRSGSEAVGALTGRRPTLVLVDVTNLDGLELLGQIKSADPGCDVVLMGAGSTTGSAIAAIRHGARGYIAKPFDPEQLRRVLNHLCEEAGRRAHIFVLEALVAEQSEFRGMLGRSPVMQDLFNLIQRLAPHAAHVLISGETGTGKELAARAFHHAGPRRGQPFMVVNCAAISQATPDPFARADQGTLFLDEIGELPAALQIRLLHLLKNPRDVESSRGLDVSVVAVTSRELGADVASGRFSKELYGLLSAVDVRLPALRDHREDIPYLTAAFVQEYGQRFSKTFDGLTPEAERILLTARWDGNVRELRNVVERACMLADGRLISERELRGTGAVATDADGGDLKTVVTIGVTAPRTGPRADHLGQLERVRIVDTLRQVGGNRKAAAKMLGISRRALYRRLERHRITQPASVNRRALAPTGTASW